MLRRSIVILIIVIVLAALGFAGSYIISNLSYARHITLPPGLLAASSTDATASSTPDSSADMPNSPGAFGPSDQASSTPASASIAMYDISSWLTYTDPVNGFSIRYPKGLSLNKDMQGSLILAFPKDSYFHWPLLDDVKATVSASSSCPAILMGEFKVPKTDVTANGYVFQRSEGSDVAAGNIYREIAYDLQRGSKCYHIILQDHGANGAGLYVSDPSLVAAYDAKHMDDLGSLLETFNVMTASFRLSQ